MSKIKVSEIFYSLQGEGKFCGTPSIFLRTFGCNFECAGFSMKDGKLSQERLKVEPNKYNNYNELPLVATGCDSYASWDPRFKHLSPMLETTEIVEKFRNILPDGLFSYDKHLIITGGEPLLGWQKVYPELIEEILNQNLGLTDITFETNGTQPMIQDLTDYIWDVCDYVDVTFSVSPKLSGSGERWDDAIKPDVIATYSSVGASMYLKFVVSKEKDIEEVRDVVETYRNNGVRCPVYLMSVGGTSEAYEPIHRNVANLAMKYGYRYSPRLQVELWKNNWGT